MKKSRMLAATLCAVLMAGTVSAPTIRTEIGRAHV